MQHAERCGQRLREAQLAAIEGKLHRD